MNIHIFIKKLNKNINANVNNIEIPKSLVSIKLQEILIVLLYIYY